jgi:hypothetical protein
MTQLDYEASRRRRQSHAVHVWLHLSKSICIVGGTFVFIALANRFRLSGGQAMLLFTAEVAVAVVALKLLRVRLHAPPRLPNPIWLLLVLVAVIFCPLTYLVHSPHVIAKLMVIAARTLYVAVGIMCVVRA